MRFNLMKEYKINEHLSLKLENDLTYIYVNGERFRNCIRLLLSIPKSQTKRYEEIDSIDEAAEFNKTLFQNTVYEGGIDHDITYEQEFIGHCSNLQAWAENNYDTRLLHSNIAFPLLKELVKAGDPQAKRVFKDEIAKRIQSGYLPVIAYLINEYYLDFLTTSERESIIQELIPQIKNLKEEDITFSTAEILNDIGYALNNIKLHDQAIIFLERALAINPHHAFAFNNLGLAFFYKNQFEMAKYYYKRGVEENPDYDIGWSNLSEIYDIERDPDKTIEMAKKAISIKPSNYEALFFLAQGFYKNGKLEEAIPLYKKALNLEEIDKKPFSLTDSRVNYCLSKIYFEKEEFNTALKYCKDAIKIDPECIEAKVLEMKIMKILT